ncbi:MAG: hypothetical protein JKY98_01325 [Gammaproteobacteria bacterium]|nr:hypothetical protein [Gammaproteobacteria bacterium]
MKVFKKAQHCLFVEEETYNWAPVKSVFSLRGLIIFSLLLSVMTVFISLS